MTRDNTSQPLRRTTVDLDFDALERARQILGTRTTKDTVNGALRELNRAAALRQAAALVRLGELDIVQPEDLAELRRSRT